MNLLDTATLNQITAQIAKQPEYVSYVDKEIKTSFEKIKQEIISKFNNHPVTVEIEEGISANNISDTLQGITNLFSFIGFEADDKPIEPIRAILQQSSMQKIISPKGDIRYIFYIPTAKDIFAITPLPWAIGRSWAKGIEEGISGIGYYLKIIRNSRSGLGIQSQKSVRPNIRFRNRQYISDLINEYNKKISELEKSTL